MGECEGCRPGQLIAVLQIIENDGVGRRQETADLVVGQEAVDEVDVTVQAQLLDQTSAVLEVSVVIRRIAMSAAEGNEKELRKNLNDLGESLNDFRDAFVRAEESERGDQFDVFGDAGSDLGLSQRQALPIARRSMRNDLDLAGIRTERHKAWNSLRKEDERPVGNPGHLRCQREVGFHAVQGYDDANAALDQDMDETHDLGGNVERTVELNMQDGNAFPFDDGERPGEVFVPAPPAAMHERRVAGEVVLGLFGKNHNIRLEGFGEGWGAAQTIKHETRVGGEAASLVECGKKSQARRHAWCLRHPLPWRRSGSSRVSRPAFPIRTRQMCSSGHSIRSPRLLDRNPAFLGR